ncbi:hypothetical protein CR513_44597, partial [Mucuna pruriens]
MKNVKGVVEGFSQRKKLKKNEEFTYYFCKKSRHMKKQCPKYAAWSVKKEIESQNASGIEHFTITKHIRLPIVGIGFSTRSVRSKFIQPRTIYGFIPDLKIRLNAVSFSIEILLI